MDRMLYRVRRAWDIDDKDSRRGVNAVVFSFSVTVLLRGFDADPTFAAVMAVAIGLYARFILGVLFEEYAEGGNTLDSLYSGVLHE